MVDLCTYTSIKKKKWTWFLFDMDVEVSSLVILQHKLLIFSKKRAYASLLLVLAVVKCYLKLWIIAGFGSGIHGCAKIWWNQHDSTSTVCYSQVNQWIWRLSFVLCYSLPSSMVIAHILAFYLFYTHSKISGNIVLLCFCSLKWQKWAWKRNAEFG